MVIPRLALFLVLLPFSAAADDLTWTCRVDEGFFGHAPVLDAAGSTLVLTETASGAVLVTWSDLVVTMEQTADPEVPPLPFSGTDSNGVDFGMAWTPGGALILSGRPGGIEFALFATCPADPDTPS